MIFSTSIEVETGRCAPTPGGEENMEDEIVEMPVEVEYDYEPETRDNREEAPQEASVEITEVWCRGYKILDRMTPDEIETLEGLALANVDGAREDAKYSRCE